MRAWVVAVLVFASGCDLQARSEARSRRRSIQQSEEEARLARARYCTEFPEECGSDQMAASDARKERAARKGNAFRAAARAMKPTTTRTCERDAFGSETCREE